MGLLIVVCDNGWIFYENYCYWCLLNLDNFYNVVVRFKCIYLFIIIDMFLNFIIVL